MKISVTTGILSMIVLILSLILSFYLLDYNRVLNHQITNLEKKVNKLEIDSKELQKDTSDFLFMGNTMMDGIVSTLNGLEKSNKRIDYEVDLNTFKDYNKFLNIKVKDRKVLPNPYDKRISTRIYEEIPLSYPIQNGEGHITCFFGSGRDPFTGKKRFHAGLDISNSGKIGAKIVATAKGKVLHVGYDKKGYGRYIILIHQYGFLTIYAHLNDTLVKRGQYVDCGQSIGILGGTGKSTGPHLHYEIRCNLTPVDPLQFMAIKNINGAIKYLRYKKLDSSKIIYNQKEIKSILLDLKFRFNKIDKFKKNSYYKKYVPIFPNFEEKFILPSEDIPDISIPEEGHKTLWNFLLLILGLVIFVGICLV